MEQLLAFLFDPIVIGPLITVVSGIAGYLFARPNRERDLKIKELSKKLQEAIPNSAREKNKKISDFIDILERLSLLDDAKTFMEPNAAFPFRASLASLSSVVLSTLSLPFFLSDASTNPEDGDTLKNLLFSNFELFPALDVIDPLLAIIIIGGSVTLSLSLTKARTLRSPPKRDFDDHYRDAYMIARRFAAEYISKPMLSQIYNIAKRNNGSLIADFEEVEGDKEPKIRRRRRMIRRRLGRR